MQLSSLVRSARHAVAVDEMRLFFKPALWDNLDGSAGLNGRRDDDPLRPYQQLWFVGNHGIVGGSGEAQALSAFPLMWVMEGAGRLVLDSAAIFPPTPPNALVDAPELRPRNGLLAGWREGPTEMRHVHPSVQVRVNARSDYRPKSLHIVF